MVSFFLSVFFLFIVFHNDFVLEWKENTTSKRTHCPFVHRYWRTCTYPRPEPGCGYSGQLYKLHKRVRMSSAKETAKRYRFVFAFVPLVMSLCFELTVKNRTHRSDANFAGVVYDATCKEPTLCAVCLKRPCRQ